jgi:hypothetical protein
VSIMHCRAGVRASFSLPKQPPNLSSFADGFGGKQPVLVIAVALASRRATALCPSMKPTARPSLRSRPHATGAASRFGCAARG